VLASRNPVGGPPETVYLATDRATALECVADRLPGTVARKGIRGYGWRGSVLNEIRFDGVHPEVLGLRAAVAESCAYCRFPTRNRTGASSCQRPRRRSPGAGPVARPVTEVRDRLHQHLVRPGRAGGRRHQSVLPAPRMAQRPGAGGSPNQCPGCGDRRDASYYRQHHAAPVDTRGKESNRDHGDRDPAITTAMAGPSGSRAGLHARSRTR
jgi:hypothetical protein